MFSWFVDIFTSAFSSALSILNGLVSNSVTAPFFGAFLAVILIGSAVKFIVLPFVRRDKFEG